MLKFLILASLTNPLWTIPSSYDFNTSRSVDQQIKILRDKLREEYPVPPNPPPIVDVKILKKFKELKYDWKKIYEESLKR